MKQEFTSKQREIIARRLGYDGPMQSFDEFLNSSPSLQAKYNAVSDKYVQRMAAGGMVKKYQVGGVVPLSASTASTSLPPRTEETQTSDRLLEGIVQPRIVYGPDGTMYGSSQEARAAGVNDFTSQPPVTQTPPQSPPQTDRGTTRPMGTEFTDIGGVPQTGGASQMTAAQIEATPDQFLSTASAPAQAAQTPISQAAAVGAAQPTTITAPTMTAAQAQPAVSEALQGVQAATGTVSPDAQIQAATQAPTTTAVGDLEAAQLAQAQRVEPVPDRTVQAGEMIDGATVDQQRVEAALRQSQQEAAQGVVTEEMTVQGQLNRMLADFDAGNPPAWAAASMRAATAQLAARGLGTSSLAGQAVIQAAMESAVPVAAADAQVFQQMGMQNLSNRQQMAVLAAQQRAQFLGQEFDQNFQARVVNASRIADIANMNFTAQQQVALENARMAQTVDLNNLSNQQAMVLANAAQIATLETANLNNRQQAAVANAQSFLQMDMANLERTQQTTLFKSQQITQALLTDQAAVNASRQFNATSQAQTDQFMASLTTQTNQFNAAQSNALSQFNIDQANAVTRFNAEQQNAREQFNANQRLVIDQANAQWRREISTANTSATNAANYLNAQNLQQMTLAEYNNEVQLFRDQVQMAWQAYENDRQRVVTLAAAEIAGKSETDSASIQSKSSMWQAVGTLAAVFL
jgi:hypothetical protein